jgi:hypothetical protein
MIIMRPQGVQVKSLGILEFASRTNLRWNKDFEEFEGRRG